MRGGRRKGAGRKPKGERRRVTLSLPADLLEIIDREAYAGNNRSEVVAKLLRKALK